MLLENFIGDVKADAYNLQVKIRDDSIKFNKVFELCADVPRQYHKRQDAISQGALWALFGERGGGSRYAS
jgi:hypothetical protein